MTETTPTPEILDALVKRLRDAVRGEVLTDAVSLGIYATDASLYQITPLAVVLPRDRESVLAAIRICTDLKVPILPRGGGTSLSGQTVARAVVIDVSKYMRRLLEVNVEERWARVEPGLVRDELNLLLKPHGLHFAPDPATSNRANVGGMIANNTGGMRSIKYGTTIDHVLEVDLALAGGEVLKLGELGEEEYAARAAAPTREGAILRGFRPLVENNREEIEARYPKVRRNSGGYLLNAYNHPRPWNMAKIVSGSEGTLGLILEARLNLEPLPRCQGLCVAHFADFTESMRAVGPIVAHGPTAVELLDRIIIDLARENLLTRDLCGFVEGRPAALLIVEAAGDTPGDVERQLGEIIADLKARGLGYAYPLVLDAKGQQDVWVMRTNGLGLMSSVKGALRPVPFIEDPAVRLEELPEYIAEVIAICERHHRPVSVYAHASVGLLHVRPMLNLHQISEVILMQTIADEVFELVLRHKGSISGEHGDGLVRSHYNERFYGPRLYAAFKELKRLFDPLGLFNPGKVVEGPPMTESLRAQATGDALQWPGHMFHYREDGGPVHAIEKCNGVGACRKTTAGVMCPSYIATRQEEHSTRGRANALRLALSGQLGAGAIYSPRLGEVLDLCLACKGCLNECPNNVDMARFKAEVLHEQHKVRHASLRDTLFGSFPDLARFSSGVMAQLANTLLETRPARALLDLAVGIDKRRTLPRFAGERLSAWFRLGRRAGHPEVSAEGTVEIDTGVAPPRQAKRRVALFNDTYLEHHEPAVGRAAVEVLEAMGFEVELAAAGCCQRPAISKGFLDEARRKGLHTMQRLDRWARKGIPILVCEPSCASALAGDLPDLIGDAALGKRVAAQVHVLEQFIEQELAVGRCALPWKENGPQDAGGTGGPLEILFHGHCHQKAMGASDAVRKLLARIPGARVTEINCGCCGMAGAFGYEKEHYAISMQIGEDRLFPALRAAAPGAVIVADGFSCRHQIRDGVGRPARHGIEVLREQLR